ncbi:hypothetical protein [Halostella sp. PRR32]|uniref:hypothetical protein n=1 Tax=Halostella sp. PRR32 TaxID=3098147 RepID=UPI002B1D931D|nr:hypothetical protein [Halostella sp. PRR32]
MSEQDIRAEDALQVAQRALSRVNDLEQRVDELEDSGEPNSEAAGYDSRDSAVVGHLEPGEPVEIKTLRQLYRRHTDIRADDTLKKRIQGLVAGPDFRIARAGVILYDPDGVNSDD